MNNLFYPDFQLDAGRWFETNGLKVILILAFAYLIRFAGIYLIDRIFARAIKPRANVQIAKKQRAETLVHMFKSSVKLLVAIITITMLLRELSIDIAPILAGAGFIGVALAVGAQHFVRDVIAGFFITSENQYKIGDYVCLDNTCGIVQEVGLRLTVLKDLDGTVHHVPNGSFSKTSNQPSDFAEIGLVIGVHSNTPLEKLIRTIDDVGTDMFKDKKWEPLLPEPPRYNGVKEFVDASMLVKLAGKVKPFKRLQVEQELRQRLKMAFDRAKIEILQPRV